MEEQIREILSEVLGLEDEKISELGVDDDLISYGLDSMNCIEIIVSLEDKFDIMTDVDDLVLDNINTIQRLVHLVESYQ